MIKRNLEIPFEREVTYYTGVILVVLGIVGILAFFFGIAQRIDHPLRSPLARSTATDIYNLTERLRQDPRDFATAPVEQVTVTPFEGPSATMLFLSVVSLLVGRGVMKWGRQGAAGAGYTLNPPQSVKDLEPMMRAQGQIIGQLVEEMKPILLSTSPGVDSVPGATEPDIKVRCGACRALNDEANVFCGQCGQPI